MAAAPAASAATVLQRTVEVEIQPGGKTYREREVLRVRMDDSADLEDWDAHVVYLDDHRRLIDADGRTIAPSGKVRKVKRKDRDQVDYSGNSFHSSSRYLLLELSALEVGSVVEVETEIEVEPYFPAASIRLLGDDTAESLEIAIRGAGPGWRWRLVGERGGLDVTEDAAGLTVSGKNVALADWDDDLPAAPTRRSALRFAWGDDSSWNAVGHWYQGLVDALPRAPPAVRKKARELTTGMAPRQALEALTAFAQREVRYVAVEVGIGGFQPSAPGEVLDRRWGDCKDKSLLLIDLLSEVGIPARPVLILSAYRSRIEPDFPSPTQFNHLIVAIPVDSVPEPAITPEPGDAVASGYLFIDPTLPRGGARWLGPSTQGQTALIVEPKASKLVTLPVLPAGEVTRVVTNLSVSEDGEGRGGMSLAIGGSRALGFLERGEGSSETERQDMARRTLTSLLPGATFDSVTWQEPAEIAPKIDLIASVQLPRLLERSGERSSLSLPAPRRAPDPRKLADRKAPYITRAGITSSTWHVNLPTDCAPPEKNETLVENEAGTFRQTLSHREGSGFTLERETVLRRNWYEGDLLEPLREIALAEYRAQRRRLRMVCSE